MPIARLGANTPPGIPEQKQSSVPQNLARRRSARTMMPLEPVMNDGIEDMPLPEASGRRKVMQPNAPPTTAARVLRATFPSESEP